MEVGLIQKGTGHYDGQAANRSAPRCYSTAVFPGENYYCCFASNSTRLVFSLAHTRSDSLLLCT